MDFARISTLLIVCLISQAAHSQIQCGLSFPDSAKEFLGISENCATSFDHEIDPANLNYLTIYDKSGVSDLLNDSTFFSNFDGKNYFVSEEVDDPRVTIKVLGQEEAQPIKASEIRGYQGKSKLLVKILPSANQKKSRPFSGRFSCLIVAEGNDLRSFKGRFCVPDNSAGRDRLKRFKYFVNGIEFD